MVDLKSMGLRVCGTKDLGFMGQITWNPVGPRVCDLWEQGFGLHGAKGFGSVRSRVWG